MAAPFCTACGATVAEGTRFCVKCGQPVGQAGPPSPTQTLIFTPASPPAPPPPPSPTPSNAETQVWSPPPPPPPPPPTQRTVEPPFPAPPIPPPQAPVQVKDGPGIGLWIGIVGILLLLGGAGLWFYTTRGPGARSVLTAQDTTPQVTPTPVAQPTPIPTPEPSTFVPAPTPNPTSEDIPANPDQPQKGTAPPPPAAPRQPPVPTPRAQPVQSRPAAAAPPPQADPPPQQPVRGATRQTSGVLHAAVEVAQNGEVVFENLPGARLRFTFDHSLWQPTISRQPNGTQTLVMRSLKAGIQTICDVRWEIVQ